MNDHLYCTCGDLPERHEEDGPCTREDCTCPGRVPVEPMEPFTWDTGQESIDRLVNEARDRHLLQDPLLLESLAQLRRGEVEPAQTLAEETQTLDMEQDLREYVQDALFEINVDQETEEIDMEQEINEGRGHSRWITSAERLENLRTAIMAYADQLDSGEQTIDRCQVREDLLAMIAPPARTITMEEARQLAQDIANRADEEKGS